MEDVQISTVNYNFYYVQENLTNKYINYDIGVYKNDVASNKTLNLNFVTTSSSFNNTADKHEEMNNKNIKLSHEIISGITRRICRILTKHSIKFKKLLIKCTKI